MQSKNATFPLRAVAAIGLTTVAGLNVSVAHAKSAHAKSAHVTAKMSHANITAAQARAVALKKFGGHVVGATTLENEEGSWQYGVNVRSGKTLREVMVDSHTGKIANVEVTTKAEEAKEAKAEAKAEAKHATIIRHQTVRHSATKIVTKSHAAK